MKKLFLILIGIILFTNINALTPAESSAIIFKAMNDEMARTIKTLKTKGMPKPYYAVYKVKMEQFFNVNAFMGEVYSQSDSEGDISVSVMMRVGSEKLDNSFFENTVISTAESQLPSLSYESLRRALWLQTDDAYKQALDQYTKKIAYLKKRQLKQEEPDFSKAQISSDRQEYAFKSFNPAYMTDIAKEMSAQGNVKAIKKFYVNITIAQGPVFFLSSEGAEYVKDDSRISISLSGEADTPAGFPLTASKKMTYKELSEIPSKEDLLKVAKDFSDEIQNAVLSPKGEAFIGPVLLEGDAAINLYSSAFVQNAINTKKVLSLNNERDYNMGEFTQKKGLKVMPIDFNVIDNADIENYNGRKLLGYYTVDDEGVKPQKLELVKEGKLVDLPATRSSGKSNGHARLGFYESKLFAPAFISNLFFYPEKTYPKAELKEQLIEKCKQENLDYCYIIRRFDGTNIVAYKVDVNTGTETLTHGFEMPTLSTRTLRDIIASGDDMNVYNYSSARNPAYSIIGPSVILSEMELKPSQIEDKKPPKLTKPEIE